MFYVVVGLLLLSLLLNHIMTSSHHIVAALAAAHEASEVSSIYVYERLIRHSFYFIQSSNHKMGQ